VHPRKVVVPHVHRVKAVHEVTLNRKRKTALPVPYAEGTPEPSKGGAHEPDCPVAQDELSSLSGRALLPESARLYNGEVNNRQLLDEAKAKTGSDSATARFLNLSRSAVHEVRKGRSHLTDYDAARLAELVGRRWHDMLALKAERAPTEAEGKYWLGKWREISRTAVAVLITVGANLTATRPAEAYEPEYRLCRARPKRPFGRARGWIRAAMSFFSALKGPRTVDHLRSSTGALTPPYPV